MHFFFSCAGLSAVVDKLLVVLDALMLRSAARYGSFRWAARPRISRLVKPRGKQ